MITLPPVWPDLFVRREPARAAPLPTADSSLTDSSLQTLAMSQHSAPSLGQNPARSSGAQTLSSPGSGLTVASVPNTPRADSPRMVSRPGTPRHPLKRSYAITDTQEIQPVPVAAPSLQDHPSTIDESQLNQLMVGFEKFFWWPKDENRAHLMATIADIRQNANALKGLDASILVLRIFHCDGLLHLRKAPDLIDTNGIRSVVSETLDCLASTQAMLFNTNATHSLAQLLPTAQHNFLLPELANMIKGDRALCGEHRVIQSIWNHSAQAGLPLHTMMILIHLSEYLDYPIPEDIPIVNAIRLIRDWHNQSPTDEEQAHFDSCLYGMTHSDTSPEAFEKLLMMAIRRGFNFTEDSLAQLIGQLIHRWEKNPRKNQCTIKLNAVFRLSEFSAHTLLVNGERALHQAARTGNYRLFALLLDHGADPDQTNAQQQSAASLLCGKREDLMAEIADVVKAKDQFTQKQYKKITAELLSQLNRNESMFDLLNAARKKSHRDLAQEALKAEDQ